MPDTGDIRPKRTHDPALGFPWLAIMQLACCGTRHLMSTEPLPPTILVQQPDGTKAKAVLLRWPVNDLPVYAVAEPSENQDEFVRYCLRMIRGCATDGQYTETAERVRQAIFGLPKQKP